MINTKLVAILTVVAVATVLMGNTVVAPALASSSSTHEFHHDVKQFLNCFRENGKIHITKSEFADCLTDFFNLHISTHSERHL
ncbi:MAG: hypothetical protein WA220_05185 [Candidatus Nitrosopolaris sp.]